MSTNDTDMEIDDEIAVDLTTMVNAHDFIGLRDAVRKDHNLAKVELVPGQGTRLIMLVSSIVPTAQEKVSHRKLLLTLVGRGDVDNWHAENLMAGDCFGRIPLHFAAAAGNDEAIKILVTRYLDLLAKYGYTESSRPEEWQKLVGQYVDAATIGGDTPLMKAAASSNPVAVHTLLHYGSNLSATNHHGKDARAFAHNFMSKILLENYHDTLLMQQNEE